jgi:membrane protein YqaA with SNARE-associated domain
MGNLVAFIWGFAEATLFFVIPDVGLSIIALGGREAGLIATGYAVLGALLGGMLMYFFGRADLDRVVAILHRIPLITPEEIENVQANLERSGIGAMFLGPFVGIPYKIYATFAHRIGTLPIFLLVSIPARGIRFVIVVLAVPFLRDRFFAATAHTAQIQVLIGIWVVGYIGYFFQKKRR